MKVECLSPLSDASWLDRSRIDLSDGLAPGTPLKISDQDSLLLAAPPGLGWDSRTVPRKDLLTTELGPGLLFADLGLNDDLGSGCSTSLFSDMESLASTSLFSDMESNGFLPRVLEDLSSKNELGGDYETKLHGGVETINLSRVLGFASVGSNEHDGGSCKPCGFIWKGGCKNGEECQFCHLCPPGEMKKRKKDKIQKLKGMKAI